MKTSKIRVGPGVKILDAPITSIGEWEHWKYSVLYLLRQDSDFKPYLKESFKFGAKTKLKPTRNLEASGSGGDLVTPADKCMVIDFMLQEIAQYCPKIPNTDITRECASLEEVWQVIRLHNNIETSGALLNDVWNITRQPNETPQDLFARIKQAYYDNLIRKDSIIYKDEVLTDDEEMSPTLHCTMILQWLQILHPKLRDVVTRQFATQLRTGSYASIYPEISRSVSSLLKGITEGDDAAVCRFQPTQSYRPPVLPSDYPRYDRSRDSRPSMRARGSNSRYRGMPSNRSTQRQCDYCRVMGRSAYSTHNIDDCLFLKKEKDRRPPYSQGASRAVEAEEYDEYDEHANEFYSEYPYESSFAVKRVTEHHINLNLVTVTASPILTMYHNNQPYNITLDSGGTCNALDTVTARELNCDVRATVHRAWQADGVTELDVIGETTVEFQRHEKSFRLRALVFRSPQSTILGGMPFFIENDISIRPAKSQIIIGGDDVIQYSTSKSSSMCARRLQSFVLRSPAKEVILPGESVTFRVPGHMVQTGTVAVEPRYDSGYNKSSSTVWPVPRVHQIINGELSLSNTSTDPILIPKNSHVCNILPAVPKDVMDSVKSNDVYPSSPVMSKKKTSPYSTPVQIDPDGLLSTEEKSKFRRLVEMYDDVFDPKIGVYNNHSGQLYVEVNMGPEPPPQYKGRVPFYGRHNLLELQKKFDALVEKGVFKRPQEVGVSVEVINPSFLVKKKASDDKRLVTDFGTISSYCRPTPALMPDVDSTLRRLGGWKFLIKTDMLEAYWQMQLKRSSMKYCGVASPMKGTYVYTRGCMGLPGTEVALEELTSRLFGMLVEQGKVVKIADDFFVGGSNVEELFQNFEEVLQILLDNNIRLKAKKTIIAPKSVQVLGWIWCGGTLTASPHKLSALTECEPPVTVKALKSYIGAYRFLSRVIQSYASLLLPLEDMISGKAASNTKIVWSDSQLSAFKAAQKALKDPKAITLPTPDDVIQIVTDAAITPCAVGAVMYVIRGDKTLLGGFFNAKLPLFQRKWMPCEVEGIAIGTALSHFGPYIIQSNHKPIVLTDSKACVEAVQKLNRGEFSTSARLCTFLSSVSRFQAVVKHIPGTVNVTSDFISRNPVQCEDKRCQMCSFIREGIESVVAAVSVPDILEGRVQLPFINKRSWVEIQEECPDLRHVFKYIRNGTAPGKKGRHLRLVRRYMSSKVTISAEGALVVRQVEAFNPTSERIVVPQKVLPGILTVLHIKLNHPSSYQLLKVFNRFFFGLTVDKAVAHCSSSCHHCASLMPVPKATRKESTDPPPEHFAQKFAADVIKRNSQLIMVLRESVSSYTQAELIGRETVEDLTASILRLSNLIRPSKLASMTIRVDPHPSHKAMFMQVQKDAGLAVHNIKLEIGRELNVNHNPVAEKAVKELILEMLNLFPGGGKLSSTELSHAVAVLNSRLRAPGVSAYEVFTQRDQTTGMQLSLDDLALINEQYDRRVRNHKYSEVSKSGGKPPHPAAKVNIGDIVYLYDDASKLSARPRYVVLAVDGEWCKIRRFADKLLGHITYSVKVTDCYLVPEEIDLSKDVPESFEEDRMNYDIVELQREDHPKTTDVTDDRPKTPEVTADHTSEVLSQEASESEDDKEYLCTVCKEDMSWEVDSLECDNCSEWCHLECQTEVSKESYEKMVEDDVVTEWNCPPCKIKLQRFNTRCFFSRRPPDYHH